MIPSTRLRSAITVEARPISVFFLRFEEIDGGFRWEIKCYGVESAVMKSPEAYRTTALARASGRAALADLTRTSFR